MKRSILQDGIVEDETIEKDDNPSKQSAPYDDSYKLFYGTWAITDIAQSDLMVPEAVEQAEKKIGEKYYFDQKEIIIEDEIFCEFPQYEISMIPMEEGRNFAGRLFPIYEYIITSPDTNDISYKVPFFCHVQVYDSTHEDFIAFYVFDDNTLILDDGIQLKMERVSHIANYEAVVGRP